MIVLPTPAESSSDPDAGFDESPQIEASPARRRVTESGVLHRDPTARVPIPTPQDGRIIEHLARPGSLVAAGDAVVRLAPSPDNDTTAAIRIAAPASGRLLRLAAVDTRVTPDVPVGELLAGFMVEITVGPDMGPFSLHDVIGAELAYEDTTYPTHVVAVRPEGNTRRVRVGVQDIANALQAGASVTVTITIQPSPEMVDAENAAKLAAWRYPIPPRGASLVKLGLAAPQTPSWAASIRRPAIPPNPFVKQRPSRDLAPYALASPSPRLTRPSHRHTLNLSPSDWQALKIATVPARVGSISVHIDAAGDLIREPASDQDFAVTAAVTGAARWLRSVMPRDLILSGEALAGIALGPEAMDAQQHFVAMPASATAARAEAALALRRIGFREPEIATLARTGKVLDEITIYAPIDGMVETCIAEGPVSAGTTLLRLRAAHTTYLSFRLLRADFEKLPPLVGVRLLAAELEERRFMGSIIDVQIDEVSGEVQLRVPVSAGTIGPDVKGWQQFRLDDPGTRHQAVLVPETCLAQVAGSREALVHIGPGQVQSVSVVCGLAGDGFVEITDGLDAGELLVHDLTDLAAEVVEMQALLLGFWQPGPRTVRTHRVEQVSNPLIDGI